MSVSDPFNSFSEELPEEVVQNRRAQTAPHSDKALCCIAATFLLIAGLVALVEVL